MLPKIMIIVCVALALSSVAFTQTSVELARKFDEFGDIEASNLIARLDNLTVQVQNEPRSKAFLIVYRTRRDLPGLSNRYAQRMRSYLVNSRGLPAERIVIVDGGVASCLCQELWIVLPGGAPKPRDDAYDNSYKPPVYKFDEHYYQIEKITDPDMLSYWASAPEDLTSYLEAFGEALLKDRKLVGYLVAFRDERDNRRITNRMLRTERAFLIKEFRIDPSRIKIVDGGYREWRTMELWIAQPGYRPIITSYRVVKFRR